MTDDDEGLGPYPEWKQAADKFMDGDKKPGELLEFEWLYEAFGMAAPDTAPSVADYQKAQLRFLNLFKNFERWLLEEQLLALQSKPGLGYEIVRPADQARWAAEQLATRMNREFRRAGRRLAYTKVEELTDQQRQQHVDTMARIGRQRAAMRQPRALPKPGAT